MRRPAALAPLLLAGCGTQPAVEPNAAAGPALFREAAEQAGLAFRHHSDAGPEYRLPEIMGSGVALLDFDMDGDLDVFLAQGAPLEPGTAVESPPASAAAELGSRLFENRIVPSGSLGFEDVTRRAGIAFGGPAMGAAVGDYDGDGDPDLYVTALGPNALFRNGGDGTFALVDGPQDVRWSASATFFDYDLDGDLDLFFTNYVDFTVRNNKQCFAPVGARDYCNPTVYNPVPDRLFRNDGDRFTDVTGAAGLGAAYGNGLGVMAADLDNDGRADLFVANDGDENQLWLNRGGGRFENVAMMAGAAVNADGRPEAGMGVGAADFDSDGDLDLLLTHNTMETNTLYLNNGRGHFVDATNRFGLGGESMPFTGFGLSWADFDHDGWLDAFVANGAVTVMESQRGQPYPFLQHDQFFRGGPHGFRVLPGERVWGRLEPLVGRGAATGDIDLDGDVDIVVSNNNGPARLLLNQVDGDRWLKVRLAARGPNRRGLGARVGLHFEDGASRWSRLHRDGSYLSSSAPSVHFGLGESSSVRAVEVVWPHGGHELFPPPSPGTAVTLRRGPVPLSSSPGWSSGSRWEGRKC